MAPKQLRAIQLTTRSHEDMIVALPQVWRGLRLAGFSRPRILWALVRAARAGDIRIDPLMPAHEGEPRVTISKP